MSNSGLRRGLIYGACSRSATAALAFAVVLAMAVVAPPSARAQTFTLLYSFQGPPLDGMTPQGELIFDKLGNLYGTTWSGGSSANGTVFELDTTGNETTLYSFTGMAGDGAQPVGEIARYAGNIYGITQYGGGTDCNSKGCGTIFELSGGREIVLHSFTDSEGHFPNGGLTLDGSGNLYGATLFGASGTPPPACGGQGCGIVFEVSHGQERVVYNFSGSPDGVGPSGKLVSDGLGNLFGTTAFGGSFNEGAVFELSPNLDGTWTERLLHSFTGKRGGGEPFAGLVRDAKGNLYGTTASGGKLNLGCCGVVFKLKQNPEGTWTELVLHTFGETANDGQFPNGSLVRDRHGNLYGVTNGGGVSDSGVVFEIDADGNEKVLHAFSGPDGANPGAGLTMDASGNLYGTTQGGGAGCAGTGGCGIVFKITP